MEQRVFAHAAYDGGHAAARVAVSARLGAVGLVVGRITLRQGEEEVGSYRFSSELHEGAEKAEASPPQ